MSIEAMKRLVAAVEAIPEEVEGWLPDALTDALIGAKEAFAEAEKQEPHSWYSAQEDEWMTNKIRKEHERLNSYTHKVGKFDLALYTNPQPKQPLTDEIPQGVLLSISNAGLTLVKTQHGYQLHKLGPVEASQGIKDSK